MHCKKIYFIKRPVIWEIVEHIWTELDLNPTWVLLESKGQEYENSLIRDLKQAPILQVCAKLLLLVWVSASIFQILKVALNYTPGEECKVI